MKIQHTCWLLTFNAFRGDEEVRSPPADRAVAGRAVVTAAGGGGGSGGGGGGEGGPTTVMLHYIKAFL